jgi:type VI secretion system protein ImpF
MSIFLPCLLERWTASGGANKSARGVLNTWQDVRRDVMRNIEWLLNTEAPTNFADQPIPQAVVDSVLCFGIEPYSGRAQSTLRPHDIAWNIRKRILAFEPRIDRHSLEVTVADPDGQHRFNKLRFTVSGQLRSDPLPIEFVVQTEIDTESGQAKVTG